MSVGLELNDKAELVMFRLRDAFNDDDMVSYLGIINSLDLVTSRALASAAIWLYFKKVQEG